MKNLEPGEKVAKVVAEKDKDVEGSDKEDEDAEGSDKEDEDAEGSDKEEREEEDKEAEEERLSMAGSRRAQELSEKEAGNGPTP